MQQVLQLLLKKFLAFWTTKVHYSDHKRSHFLSFSYSFIPLLLYFPHSSFVYRQLRLASDKLTPMESNADGQTDGRIDSPTEIRVTNGCWGAINETLLIQPSAQFCNPWILLLTFQASMLRNSYQLYHHTVSIGRPFFSFTERQATSVHVGYLIFITSPLFPADFQTS